MTHPMGEKVLLYLGWAAWLRSAAPGSQARWSPLSPLNSHSWSPGPQAPVLWQCMASKSFAKQRMQDPGAAFLSP